MLRACSAPQEPLPCRDELAADAVVAMGALLPDLGSIGLHMFDGNDVRVEASLWARVPDRAQARHALRIRCGPACYVWAWRCLPRPQASASTCMTVCVGGRDTLLPRECWLSARARSNFHR